MKTYTQFSLQKLNSFNIKATTPKIYFPSNTSELIEVASYHLANFYILGDGSNTLFCQQQAPVIIKPSFKGIEVTEDTKHFRVSVACAENWHDLVKFCIENEIFGLENLALIPGCVGAAPVQNIGAYGVEVGDFIDRISWFDFSVQKVVNYSNAQCQFAYRDSLFKSALNGKGVITHVHFKFPKNWQPVISYQGLNDLSTPISAQDIMDKVIQLRKMKLPDPKHLANAGSFFKNPVVSKERFNFLQQRYSDIPCYPQSTGEIKLAAGWLIEQSGLKGFRQRSVGVHDKQALVIVNYDDGSGQEIVDLAQHIQTKVKEKFNIQLVPEVRFIALHGEISHASKGCE
jgi:UDP-N-acetylmuramate dehydrogenase